MQEVGVGAAPRAWWRRRHSSRAPPRSTLAAGTEGGQVTCGGQKEGSTRPHRHDHDATGVFRVRSLLIVGPEGRRARPQPEQGMVLHFMCTDARAEHMHAGTFAMSD